ncbi:MAG: hypothetical protein ACYCOU_15285 [Sulfobacillus sp.]
MPGAFVPYLPPMDPYVMPGAPFDAMINQYGIRLMWMKSHDCPCVYGGSIPGSPDSGCQQCHGRGVYWDAGVGPFMGLITYSQMVGARSIDDPGATMDETYGVIQRADPILTIPATPTSPNGPIWTQASMYDAYVELDAVTRFTTTLEVGGFTALPYQQSAAVAVSGAVTVYDAVSKTVVVVPASDYTFANGSVTLTGYPQGTAYTVEYTAAPVYVAWKKAGSTPHTRPFGAGVPSLPKRFQLQLLDLWTRARAAGSASTSPQAIP